MIHGSDLLTTIPAFHDSDYITGCDPEFMILKPQTTDVLVSMSKLS